jgi:hypothetical protein
MDERMETALRQHRFLLAIKASFASTEINDDVHIEKIHDHETNILLPCRKLGICMRVRAVCKSSSSA